MRGAREWLRTFYLTSLILSCLAVPAQTGSPAGTAPAPKADARAWLDANLKSPDFALRLERFARDEEKPETALRLFADYYPSLREPEKKKTIAALAGEYCELVSDYRAAAGWYAKAVFAPEAPRDAELRLRCAYCLMAIGEFQEARTFVEAVSSPQAAFDPAGDLSAVLRVKAKASMAGFWNSLLSRRTDGLEADMIAFLEDDGAKAVRPEGLLLLSFLQWRSIPSDAGAYRPGKPADTAYGKKLVQDYPDSPEARICIGIGNGNNQAKNGLRLAENPLWLMGGFLVRDPDSPFEGQASGTFPAPSPKGTPSESRGPSDLSGQKLVSFQVGTFAQRANAEGLVAGLRSKSFKVEMKERKNAKGQTLFVVLVAAGDDPRDTDLRLKESGIESLPIFE